MPKEKALNLVDKLYTDGVITEEEAYTLSIPLGLQKEENKTLKEKTEFQCQFCLHVFKKHLGPRTYEVSCPKCREIDVQVTSFFGIQKRDKS